MDRANCRECLGPAGLAFDERYLGRFARSVPSRRQPPPHNPRVACYRDRSSQGPVGADDDRATVHCIATVRNVGGPHIRQPWWWCGVPLPLEAAEREVQVMVGAPPELCSHRKRGWHRRTGTVRERGSGPVLELLKAWWDQETHWCDVRRHALPAGSVLDRLGTALNRGRRRRGGPCWRHFGREKQSDQDQ